MEINYRPLHAENCPAVIELHQAAFPREQVARTIYGAHGVHRYLQSLIAFPLWQQAHAIVGAWCGEQLVGYAHGRALSDAWHLNNIAILPGYQGRGIGRQLWQRFVAMGQTRGMNHITLFSEHDNKPVLRWYQRCGLRETGRTWLYEKPLVAAPNEEHHPIQLLDWETAEAWQQSYGFSQFRLCHNHNTWTIGRLGQDYFRVTGPIPAPVEAVLSAMDSRRCLLVVSERPLPQCQTHLASISIKMEGKSEHVDAY